MFVNKLSWDSIWMQIIKDKRQRLLCSSCQTPSAQVHTSPTSLGNVTLFMTACFAKWTVSDTVAIESSWILGKVSLNVLPSSKWSSKPSGKNKRCPSRSAFFPNCMSMHHAPSLALLPFAAKPNTSAMIIANQKYRTVCFSETLIWWKFGLPIQIRKLDPSLSISQGRTNRKEKRWRLWPSLCLGKRWLFKKNGTNQNPTVSDLFCLVD